MRPPTDRRLPFALAVLLVLALPRDAFAYLDPGSGSYLLQVALATLLGASYALRLKWRQIRDWVARRRGGASGDADPTKPTPDA